MQEFILNTERKTSQAMYMEGYGKFSPEYLRIVSTAEMNLEDAKVLGIRDRVKLMSRDGVSVIVNVKVTDGIPRGTIFLPPGPWANVLITEGTDAIGVPSFRNEKIFVDTTTEPVTSLEEILRILSAKVLQIPHGTDIPLKSGEKRIIENVACPICAELCDYLKIEITGNRIVRNIGGCAKSVSKFLNYHKDRILKPYIRINDKLVEVSLEEALDKAADILVNAKYPLIYGLSITSVKTDEYAIQLAELLRGAVDNPSTFCHGPTSLAVQEVGGVFTTFSDVINLADLVIFWGSDPINSHVNHLSRNIVPKGRFIGGRKDRKIVVIDIRRTELANMADLFIQVKPGRDVELITALRMALHDLDIEVDNVAGVPRDMVYKLADMMASAKYGVIMYGLGITENGVKHRSVEELMKLVQDLNEYTKFAVMPMRGHYNVVGSNEASLWLTGYPYAVDFARGFSRMYVGVTTAMDLLINGDVDAALIVGHDPVASFPRKAVQHLSRIPVIVIDPKWSLTTAFADVIIPSGMTGIECEGSAYRMDKIPIRMKKILDPPPGVLCDYEILKLLIDRVINKKVGKA
ncbi:formylmethanofuran dehydrogenase subunit B [Vulcanisaeta sp. JCM 14467]